jgi:arginine deiminase
VAVHHFGQLLAETLELPGGRAFVLDRVCTPQIFGPALAGPVRELLEDLYGARLAEYLIGGVLKADLRPSRARSLKWDMLRADDFLPPAAQPPAGQRERWGCARPGQRCRSDRHG